MTAESPVSEARPLEGVATEGDASSAHVAWGDDLEATPFWELLRLAGYETW